MQQQIRTQTPKKNKPAASLIISWLIILGVYLLLRLVFVIFGFHLAPVVLGGCGVGRSRADRSKKSIDYPCG